MGILLAIHLIITIALVLVVLVQKSNEDGLGLSGGNNAMMSSRGAANFFTRLTAILATLFISNAILITIVTSKQVGTSAIDSELISVDAKKDSEKTDSNNSGL